jgi:hypothetical protein
MRSRLLLGGIAAGLALSFVPQANAAEAPVNCHNMGWLCTLLDETVPSTEVNCHHIGWLCTTINDLVGGTDGGR